MRANFKWAAGAIGAIGVLVTVASARAQAPTPAVAEALFDEGKALFERGDIANACRKFEESVRIDPLPGSVLNLAVCHEAEGRVASAWTEFKQALALARADGRKDRQALAEERIAALEPVLPKLTVSKPPNAASATLFLDDQPIGGNSFDLALPVDPGVVHVRVEAAGYRAWEEQVEVKLSERQTLSPPALEKLPAPPPILEKPAIVRIEQPPPPQPAQPWATLGWATLGGGAAVAIVGFALGAYALAEENLADDVCSPATCPDEASLAHSHHAQLAATVASTLVPIGLTFAVGGMVIGLTATFTPNLYGTQQVTVGGRF
ncbi:MAG: hypothetical protein U0271_08280 [Polyangiaceae bacterium]